MAAPTVAVTATIYDQGGDPIAGATITMELDRAEFYQGFIVKESVSVETDALGVAVLNVFPNELGSNGSQYKVVIVTPQQTIRSTAIVPNSACNLHDIMQIPPYPAISLSQQAMTAAQHYAAQASASEDSAEAAKNLAVSSATTAATASGTAQTAASTAVAARDETEDFRDEVVALVSGIGDALVFKGPFDASASPNYPAGNAGDLYKVSVGGKVGGVSGVSVEIGDAMICINDGTASGDQATAGAYWFILQTNVDGAVIGPASSVSGRIATFNGTGGKLIQDSGTSISDLIAKSLGTAAGDIIYFTAAGTPAALPKGTDGEVLSLVSGLPSWETASGGTSKWTALIATTDFSTTAASTSTITMNTDQTGAVKVGMGVKFTLSGVVYYAIVTAITSNLLTIAGAPLTTGAGALTALSYGLLPVEVQRIPLYGYWGYAASSTAFADNYNYPLIWRGAPAYLVAYRVYGRTVDTGASKERITPSIAGNVVSTANSNNGLEVTAATTWYSSVVDISSANYAVTNGQTVELKVQGNGTNKDSSDLEVELVWVYA